MKAIHTAGIVFAITSGRPPRGMAMLIDPLALRTPVAGFNGGTFVQPDMTIMEEHVLAAEVARRALEVILRHSMDVWVYSGKDWFVRDANAPHVAREQWTVQFAPTVVANFESVLSSAVKIVGVSDDLDLVARCEKDTQDALGEEHRPLAHNLTTSTSPIRTPTKEPSSLRCRSCSQSRPMRSRRSETCRTTC